MDVLEKFEKGDSSLSLNLTSGQTKTIVTLNLGEQETSYDLQATVARDATLNIYNVISSDKNAKLKEVITLAEAGATVNIMNVILGTNNSVINSLVDITHLVGNTTSNFETYAISKDASTLNLDNNATIKKGSAKAKAHQKAKGLTISKDSKIKAMPNLFIDEYDVIAFHSASIGSINKEDLFYLMSRGLSLEEASKIIVLGFVEPILDKIEDEELVKLIREDFTNKLSK